MTTTFEPLTGLVTITDRAAEKARELLVEKELPEGALRVFVVGGGCSGYQYGMALARKPEVDDTQIEAAAGVRILVDAESGPAAARRGGRLRRRADEVGLHDLQPERGRLVRVRLLVPGVPRAAAGHAEGLHLGQPNPRHTVRNTPPGPRLRGLLASRTIDSSLGGLLKEHAMQAWIVVGSADNFELLRERGFDIAAFKASRTKQASAMQPGDRIVFYLTKVVEFGGVVEVTSEAFEDNSDIGLRSDAKENEAFPQPHPHPPARDRRAG